MNKSTHKERGNGSSQKAAGTAGQAGDRSNAPQTTQASEGMPAAPRSKAATLPFLRQFAEELDRAFEGFGMGAGMMANWPSRILRGFGDRSTPFDSELWAPPVELFQRGDRLIIRADLPGLSKEDIHVEAANGRITIQGERRQEHEENAGDYYHSERSYGSFFRSIALPDGVETDHAEATFRNGVLEIAVLAARREASDRRRLEVKG